MGSKMWGVVRMLAVMVAIGAAIGCAERPVDGDPSPIAEGTSPELAAIAEQQLRWLEMDPPDALEEGRLREDQLFRRALYRAHDRYAAMDSFLAHRDAPTDSTTWVSLLEHCARRQYIPPDWDLDGMLQAAAGGDSSSARFQYIEARRFWKSDRQRAHRHIRRAADLVGHDRSMQAYMILNYLCFVQLEQGQPDSALATLGTAIPMAWEAGGYIGAALAWERAVRLARRARRPADLETALGVHARLAHRSGEAFLIAHSLYQRAYRRLSTAGDTAADSLIAEGLTWARAIDDRNCCRGLLGLESLVAKLEGDDARRIRATTGAMSIATAARDTNYMMRYAYGLAEVYRDEGDLARCEEWLERTAAIDQRWPKSDLSVAVALLRYDIAAQSGLHTEADSLHLEAYEVARKNGDRGSMLKSSTVHAYWCIEQNRPGQAFEALERAQAALDQGVTRIMSSDPEFLVNAVAANLHACAGDYHRARECLDWIAANPDKVSSFDIAYAAETRAAVAEQSGDLESAIDEWRQAADHSRTTSDQLDVAFYSVRQARTMIRSGDHAEAEAIAAEFLDDQQLWPRLNARIITAMARNRTGRHQLALDMVALAREVYGDELLPHFAARLALESARAQAALGRHGEALAEALTIQPLLSSHRLIGSEHLDRSFNLRIVREAAEFMLGLLMDQPGLMPGPDRVRATRAIAAWGRGDELTRPRDARLEFFVGEQRAFVWYAPAPGAAFDWGELLDVPELTRLATSLIIDTSSPGREIDWQIGRRLGEALFSVAHAFHPEQSILEIAPDGVLRSLPWAALHHPRGELLLESGPIVLVSGVHADAGENRGGRGILIIGNNGDAAGNSTVLQHAEDEARAVGAAWTDGPVSLQLGSSDPAAALTAPHKAIHIASHTQVFSGTPGFAALYMAGRTGRPLALQDLSSLDIDAELVFLSSCEGALRHRASGRGVSSFADAFQEAGARRVIASSVLVDDAAARKLAVAFYEEWSGQIPAEAALREALLRVKSESGTWEHPFYWAFFNVYEGFPPVGP